MLKNKFSILFLFLFFLLNVSVSSADTIQCSFVSGCGASQASCATDVNTTCNCGTGVASCADLGTMQCAGPNGGDAITCWAGERCECAPPVVISGCTDPAATNYDPNASADDGSCSYPPPPPNCGNGVVNAGEQCDLGINNGSCPGGCSLSCTTISCNPPGATCGNGLVDPGEQCDTGGNNGGCPRSCSNSCTVNSCGGTISTLTFTASGPGTAVSPWGNCRGATCVLPLPTGTYVTIDAIHDFAGAFNWQAVCPALGVGARCEGPLNADYSAGVTFAGVTTPVVNNISISSSDINPNGSTQYTITAVASDSGGGNKINQQYALINHQGGVPPTGNQGAYRGYLTWASYSFTGHKDNMACTGGGYAAIQSTGGNSVYGHDYIELDSCTTTVVGGTRTTNFVVRFNPLFGTNGPWTLNDISGYTSNSDNNWNGWTNFNTDFGLITTPSTPVVTISSPTVTTNNSTQYQITVTSTDARGGGNISHEYALINYQGSNSAFQRGYLTWYYDSAYTGWNALKNKMSCTGGGIAAIQSGYGDSYLNLDSCTNTINGNTRTTVYTVRFDTSYVQPLTNNDISGFVQNKFNVNTGWINNDINFSLNINSPSLSASPSTVAPGGTVTLTFANVPVPTVRDWIGQYVLGNTGNSFIAGSQGWKYVGVSPCTQTVPGASRASGTCTFTVPATPGSYNFRLWDNDNILVQHAVSNTVTVVAPPSVTLSANPTTVTSGGSSVLTWTVGGSVTSCTASGSWSGAKSTSGGSQSTGALASSQTYNLSCTGPGGTTVVTPVTVTVTAPSTYTLTISPNPSPGGRITGTGINCGVDCSESISGGTNITLTASPTSSYWKFTGWVGACSGTATTCNLTINGNTTVSATFVPRAFIYREF